MYALYQKNELTFALVQIALYCVLQSLAGPLNQALGVAYSASAVFCLLQAVLLWAFCRRHGLLKRYGLCRPTVPARRFFYYLPLAVLVTANLWYGVAVSAPAADTVCQVVCMLGVGFLEELLFRGLLFVAMAKSGVRAAVIVSSVTFGLGHILNLFNGSGMDPVSNLCQIVLAVAFGFLLVTIFTRGGSLLPCILTHAANNALNTFSDPAGWNPQRQLVQAGVMAAIIVAYTLLLLKTLPPRE